MSDTRERQCYLYRGRVHGPHDYYLVGSGGVIYHCPGIAEGWTDEQRQDLVNLALKRFGIKRSDYHKAYVDSQEGRKEEIHE